MQPTVLLADDSAAARSILKLFLAGVDARVVEVDRADRALQALRLMRVDLVITDANMPGMDGVSFVAAARKDGAPSVRDVPIILLTASRELGVKEAALRAGASAFLAKPVDARELVASVTALLAPQRNAPAVC